MTYTTQQLRTISDFEVNKALAKILPYTQVIGSGKYPSQSEDAVHVERRKTKYGNIEELGVDYCNNPNDIMPLAFDRSICLIQTDVGKELGQWTAFTWIGVSEYINTNPLRAIACLILMMEG